MHPTFTITGLLCLLFLLGFAVTSYFEKEKRASAMALIMATIYGAGWFLAGHIYPGASLPIAIAFWVMLIAGLGLLAWPFGKPPRVCGVETCVLSPLPYFPAQLCSIVSPSHVGLEVDLMFGV